mmetsp:Transcript_37405/g.117860  ORF Transcript_37405/g.117860 Transcript_37405/m.117860 type:complete len:551 (+) Transcript_37405:367-2019(+)
MRRTTLCGRCKWQPPARQRFRGRGTTFGWRRVGGVEQDDGQNVGTSRMPRSSHVKLPSLRRMTYLYWTQTVVCEARSSASFNGRRKLQRGKLVALVTKATAASVLQQPMDGWSPTARSSSPGLVSLQTQSSQSSTGMAPQDGRQGDEAAARALLPPAAVLLALRPAVVPRRLTCGEIRRLPRNLALPSSAAASADAPATEARGASMAPPLDAGLEGGLARLFTAGELGRLANCPLGEGGRRCVPDAGAPVVDCAPAAELAGVTTTGVLSASLAMATRRSCCLAASAFCRSFRHSWVRSLSCCFRRAFSSSEALSCLVSSEGNILLDCWELEALRAPAVGEVATRAAPGPTAFFAVAAAGPAAAREDAGRRESAACPGRRLGVAAAWPVGGREARRRGGGVEGCCEAADVGWRPAGEAGASASASSSAGGSSLAILPTASAVAAAAPAAAWACETACETPLRSMAPAPAMFVTHSGAGPTPNSRQRASLKWQQFRVRMSYWRPGHAFCMRSSRAVTCASESGVRPLSTVSRYLCCRLPRGLQQVIPEPLSV